MCSEEHPVHTFIPDSCPVQSQSDPMLLCRYCVFHHLKKQHMGMLQFVAATLLDTGSGGLSPQLHYPSQNVDIPGQILL